ncbi:DHHC zinc finger domain protein, partial [Cooperia oncophora]
SHHCPICKICVLRKDHHCFITGACVGLGNQRYFITFLFWCCIGLIAGTRYTFVYLYRASSEGFPTRVFVLCWSSCRWTMDHGLYRFPTCLRVYSIFIHAC